VECERRCRDAPSLRRREARFLAEWSASTRSWLGSGLGVAFDVGEGGTEWRSCLHAGPRWRIARRKTLERGLVNQIAASDRSAAARHRERRVCHLSRGMISVRLSHRFCRWMPLTNGPPLSLACLATLFGSDPLSCACECQHVTRNCDHRRLCPRYVDARSHRTRSCAIGLCRVFASLASFARHWRDDGTHEPPRHCRGNRAVQTRRPAGAQPFVASAAHQHRATEHYRHSSLHSAASLAPLSFRLA